MATRAILATNILKFVPREHAPYPLDWRASGACVRLRYTVRKSCWEGPTSLSSGVYICYVSVYQWNVEEINIIASFLEWQEIIVS